MTLVCATTEFHGGFERTSSNKWPSMIASDVISETISGREIIEIAAGIRDRLQRAS